MERRGSDTLQERNHFKDINTYVRVALKPVLKKYGERAWTRFIWIRKG